MKGFLSWRWHSTPLKLSLLYSLIAGLAGCAAMQGEVSPEQLEAFVAYHSNMAQKQIDAGAYPEALVHIKILETKMPENGNYRQNIADIEKLIRHKKADALTEAEKLTKQGELDKAKKHLLTALSMEPSDGELIKILQQHNTRVLREEQALKQAKYPGLMKRQQANQTKTQAKNQSRNVKKTPKSDPIGQFRTLYASKDYQGLILKLEQNHLTEVPLELESWLVEAHIHLARKALDSGQLNSAVKHANQALAYGNVSQKQVRQLNSVTSKLAPRLVKKGKGLVRKDINQAISLMEQASIYAPNDTKIEIELTKAQRIKDNLERIKALN